LEQIQYGPSVCFVFRSGEHVEPALFADVGRYTINTPNGRAIEQSESKPSELGETLALVGARVDAAAVRDAALEIMFSDGRRLRCEPSTEYEAWQVVGGEPGLIYSTSDGEVDGA
jgi:hypothetical protein